jgi:predicted transcriptional regulator
MNWNSKKKKYYNIKGFKPKFKRFISKLLFFYGWEVKEIANLLKLSKSRIYEYLR